MIIEIEVSEDLIREEVQRQAAKAIADKLNHWELKSTLDKAVKNFGTRTSTRLCGRNWPIVTNCGRR